MTKDADTHADVSAELQEDSSSLSSTEDEVNELATYPHWRNSSQGI